MKTILLVRVLCKYNLKLIHVMQKNVRLHLQIHFPYNVLVLIN